MPQKILIVEDDASTAEGIAYSLEQEGFEVVVAADGDAALSAFEQQAPDLVILDLTLPGISGWQLLTAFRRQRPVSVIVLTARVEEADRVAGLEMGAVALLHDVTELRRMDEVRRDFVANASHELRTPVTGIKALAEAMQAGALQDPEKGPRFLDQILEAADRLTLLLDDMLTLTRVERGPEFVSPEPVVAAKALAEAVAHMEPSAMAKGVDLRTEVAEEDLVHADPASLQTVLINLLDNAIRHTPADGEVVLSGHSVSEGYQVRVADTGVGIAEDHIPRIFERFYRVDPGRGRDSGGTGLGLAIVKHIAEAHGGRVAVRATQGGGATFSVFFPAPQP